MRRATGPASVEQLSSSLRFPDGASSWASVRACSVLNDVCGISCWMPRTIDLICLMFSLALSHLSSPRIPTGVGVWQAQGRLVGPQRSSPSPSWSLLSPPLPFRKKTKSHVRSLSQPPPLRYCKVTAVTGSRRHLSGANLLFSDPPLLALLDSDICFWLFVAPILTRSS